MSVNDCFKIFPTFSVKVLQGHTVPSKFTHILLCPALQGISPLFFAISSPRYLLFMESVSRTITCKSEEIYKIVW